MPSTSTDRLNGLTTSVAIKAPCKHATTGNITLFGLGVQGGGPWSEELDEEDGDAYTRVFVWQQDDPVENGIYNPKDSAWQRAKDFDGNRDAVQGTLVPVYPASAGTMFYELQTANPVVIGTSEIEFMAADPGVETLVARLADPTSASNGDAMLGWGSITTIVDGELTRYATLAAAVSGLGSTIADIVVRDAIAVSASTTVPSTAGLVIENGAVLTVASGQTLTVNGAFRCPPMKWLDGAGSAVLNHTPGYEVEWFGAVADGDEGGGGTNNYTAIAKALATITASNAKGRLKFRPGRVYRCDEGLVIDACLHSMQGGGAMLDFYHLDVADNALELTAVARLPAGGSFYAATNCIEGMVFKGREGVSESAYPTVTRNGLLITGGVSSVVTGFVFSRCIFQNFTDAYQLSPIANAQAVACLYCNFLFNARNVFFPLASGGAAGSKMLFVGGFMSIGVHGFDLRNSSADVVVSQMNVEVMYENFFYHLGGHLTVSNCHVETNTDAIPYIYRAESGVAGYENVRSRFSLSNTEIIVKGARTSPVFDLSKVGSWSISGGTLNASGATHTTALFQSDGAATGLGVLSIEGMAINKTNADTVFDLDDGITIRDSWGEAAGFTAGQNEAFNVGEETVTPTSLTVTGTPLYSLTWTRDGDRCKCTLQIDANGGTTASTANTTYFSGLPYEPAEAAVGSVIAANVTGGGQAYISTTGGGRIYTPTWVADALVRTVSFEYRIVR